MDDWDDVWEQWDDEDCCENFEFELQKEKEVEGRHQFKETIKTFKYFSRYLDRKLKGREKTSEDLFFERSRDFWKSFSDHAPTTEDDYIIFFLRRRQLAEYSIFGLARPTDDMVFEAKQGYRRSCSQLFNYLFRIDAENIEDFRSFIVQERLEEITRKKAARKANRKRHHRRGKGTTKKDKEKGYIFLKNIGNESTPGTLAGSPPLGGSNSLGLSSFEDRFSSLTTSCVSHTLAIKSNYLKSINTCDEEHPSVSRIISNDFHRSKVEC